jgi:hypothetical protein
MYVPFENKTAGLLANCLQLSVQLPSAWINNLPRFFAR